MQRRLDHEKLRTVGSKLCREISTTSLLSACEAHRSTLWHKVFIRGDLELKARHKDTQDFDVPAPFTEHGKRSALRTGLQDFFQVKLRR